jgi:hypothetical protein
MIQNISHLGALIFTIQYTDSSDHSDSSVLKQAGLNNKQANRQLNYTYITQCEEGEGRQTLVTSSLPNALPFQIDRLDAS